MKSPAAMMITSSRAASNAGRCSGRMTVRSSRSRPGTGDACRLLHRRVAVLEASSHQQVDVRREEEPRHPDQTRHRADVDPARARAVDRGCQYVDEAGVRIRQSHPADDQDERRHQHRQQGQHADDSAAGQVGAGGEKRQADTEKHGKAARSGGVDQGVDQRLAAATRLEDGDEPLECQLAADLVLRDRAQGDHHDRVADHQDGDHRDRRQDDPLPRDRTRRRPEARDAGGFRGRHLTCLSHSASSFGESATILR